MKREKLDCISVVTGRRTLGREGRGLEAGASGGNKSQHRLWVWDGVGRGRKGDRQRRQQGGRGPGIGAPGVQCPGGPRIRFVHSSVTPCVLSESPRRGETHLADPRTLSQCHASSWRHVRGA